MVSGLIFCLQIAKINSVSSVENSLLKNLFFPVYVMFSHLMLIGSGVFEAVTTRSLKTLTSYSFLPLSLHLWHPDVCNALKSVFFSLMLLKVMKALLILFFCFRSSSFSCWDPFFSSASFSIFWMKLWAFFWSKNQENGSSLTLSIK